MVGGGGWSDGVDEARKWDGVQFSTTNQVAPAFFLGFKLFGAHFDQLE